jgi:hypothetical protein
VVKVQQASTMHGSIYGIIIVSMLSSLSTKFLSERYGKDTKETVVIIPWRLVEHQGALCKHLVFGMVILKNIFY